LKDFREASTASPLEVVVPGLPSLGLRYRAYRNGRRTTAPAPSGPPPQATYVVDCAIYVDGQRLDGTWTHAEAIDEVRRRGSGFVWIGLYEPDEDQINGIAETFGLHELAVEDAVHAHQRPKLERYDNTLFMVLKTVRYVANETLTANSEIVESGELMAFIGRDFIISWRWGRRRCCTESPTTWWTATSR
jgi:magnesium transporter